MQKQGTVGEWLAVGVTLFGILAMAGWLAVQLLQRTPAAAPAPMAQAPSPIPAAPTTAPLSATAVLSATNLLTAAVATLPLSPTSAAVVAAAPAAPPAPRAAAYEPRFEPAPCPIALPAGATVECGVLYVPEDRSTPDGPQVALAVAILRSSSPTPAPDPVIYLEGGPGGTALYSIERWIAIGLHAERDVIVIDQRGTGFSEPALDCPEVSNFTLRYLRSPEWFQRDGLLVCRRRLASEGVLLKAYHSAANAADIDDLRQALGYEQVNLFGISYGTRLALTVMRDYPQHIRSVTLDSTYPPQIDLYAEYPANVVRAFDALFDGCAADAACAAAYGDVRGKFYGMVERLNERAVLLTLTEPRSGTETPVVMTGDSMVGLLFLLLYDTNVIPQLPRVMALAADGDYAPLEELLAAVYFSSMEPEAGLQDLNNGFSEGMYYSVQCQDEMPFTDTAALKLRAAAVPVLEQYFLDGFDLDQVMCRIWRVPARPDLENVSVQSDIPTLILAGQYDPITPPAWGQRAAESLPQSYYFEFPGYGHGVSVDGPCATSVLLAFLRDPSVAPDGSCVAALPPLAFVVR